MASEKFAEIVLPLALPKLYTYKIPEHLDDQVAVGKRVEVSLRRKLYAGIVYSISNGHEHSYTPKDIESIIDDSILVDHTQLKFWKWIADYYCCTIGEVMQAALPAGLKLESETKIKLHPDFDGDTTSLNHEEYLITEALTLQEELTIQQVSDILGKKTIYPIIRTLIDHQVVDIHEQLIEKYKEKKIRAVRLHSDYAIGSDHLELLLREGLRSINQERAILAYLSISKNQDVPIPVTEIYEYGRVNNAIIKALEKNGIFIIEKITVSRISYYGDDILEVPELSDEQLQAVDKINELHQQGQPVLIHGITGSGKTRLYMELIKQKISEGKQALYLLPEIALTTQIVERLEQYFGEDMVVYHSRMSDAERVEVWNAIQLGKKLVLAARSGIFLPFSNLGLIIVDEEHDPSYKQTDPSPRYNARDMALVLGKFWNAHNIMGSATPSLESYHNALQHKYGLITVNRRYGSSVLPVIKVVDLRQEKQVGRLKGTSISKPLEDAITDFLAQKKQVILFQNRRGFAPMMQCMDCGWMAQCINCDVNLTLHRYSRELKCHYCGYRHKIHTECPDCNSTNLFEMGQGTERIEEDVKTKFPNANIARMDYDTASSKAAFTEIIHNFCIGKTDILIGTQMVTKGFDFDHLGLVGIISADSMLSNPDFRAGERAFQLMTQVAGRAGRRGDQGLVIIQTFQPNHPVIDETINYHYGKFFNREMHERHSFIYPPFYKLIILELKHKDPSVLDAAAAYCAQHLKAKLGNRVKGPAIPGIPRIKNLYIQNITIKMENNPKIINFTKRFLIHLKGSLLNEKGIKSVRINIDVDPY